MLRPWASPGTEKEPSKWKHLCSSADVFRPELFSELLTYSLSVCLPSLLECSSGTGPQMPPMAKVMRKEAWHTQRRDRASGVPLEILEHLPPKPESAYFLLCALTYTSDFTGGCPPLPISEKKELTYSSS